MIFKITRYIITKFQPYFKIILFKKKMSTDINYEEYNGHFAKNAPTIAGGPSQ